MSEQKAPGVSATTRSGGSSTNNTKTRGRSVQYQLNTKAKSISDADKRAKKSNVESIKEDVPQAKAPSLSGSLQLLRETLIEPSPPWPHIDDEYLDLVKLNIKSVGYAHTPMMTNTTPPVTVTPPVNTTGALVTNTVPSHAEKPEKFNGQNFKRWQQKMFFYLTTLNLARFLKETAPQVEPPMEGQSSNAQAVQATTTANELWESLERKYKTEDADTKKFVVLLHDIHAEGMTLSETFQVAAIIEKLLPSWEEFRNYSKHKQKEMSVEDLVVRLRIEEDNKLAQKDTYTPDSAKANMVEHAGSSSRSNSKGKGKDKRKNDKKSKGKSEYLAPKAGIMKQKF
ncbi:hypothetical protein Tco_0740208 [Tanacetum coccineum]